MTEVGALVLHSATPDMTAKFYRALGIPFDDEDHGEGPAHHAAELAGVHVAIYPAGAPGRAPTWRGAGSVLMGFYVESLDAVVADLTSEVAPQLGGHEQMPWGCRVVFEDPDGRPVEINQRGHCAPVEVAAR